MRKPSSATMSTLRALLWGLLLRSWMVHKYPLVQGDSLIYGRIAVNWLQHGVYGFGDSGAPTLIRLPGYPLFLAAMFKLFGLGNFLAVLRAQVLIDLLTCLLIAAFVREWAGARARRIALWAAVLCPFTAMYVAAPLTETLSIFCVALAMLAASHWLRNGFAGWKWPAALAFALAYSILLRPDGGLLAAAVLGYVAVKAAQSPLRRNYAVRLLTVSIATLLPLVPWTLRNERTFHLFQPLAPRYANDPGEATESGYKAWVKTWFVDYASNEEFYWCADDCPLDIRYLPNRAFDSPEQRQRTAALLNAANYATANGSQYLTGPIDEQFAELAAERRRTHPLRSYVELPLLRLADMLLRPRTELLPIPARWWLWRNHARTSLLALALAVVNLGYLALAALAFLRRRVPLAAMLLAYVGLRCLLLLTLENAEPRYTLELYPIMIAALAFGFVRRSATSAEPSSSSSS
jgi:4-amino-4-deoxy-L-arabinose transferase-like glycosyltransferase